MPFFPYTLIKKKYPLALTHTTKKQAAQIHLEPTPPSSPRPSFFLFSYPSYEQKKHSTQATQLLLELPTITRYVFNSVRNTRRGRKKEKNTPRWEGPRVSSIRPPGGGGRSPFEHPHKFQVGFKNINSKFFFLTQYTQFQVLPPALNFKQVSLHTNFQSFCHERARQFHQRGQLQGSLQSELLLC